MRRELMALAVGVSIGMLTTVKCKGLYQKLSETCDCIDEKLMAVKDKTQSSMQTIKGRLMRKKDKTIDLADQKIDDLIEEIDKIDITPLKTKSKKTFESLRQKIISLKNL